MEQQVATATKPIKIPGPDHPITIERNPARIVVTVAGRVVAVGEQHDVLMAAGLRVMGAHRFGQAEADARAGRRAFRSRSDVQKRIGGVEIGEGFAEVVVIVGQRANSPGPGGEHDQA